MFTILMSLIFVTLFSCQQCADIEKYIKTCSRNSKESNECMVKAVRSALPRLCDGIPELDIPPLDPFHQNELHLEYNRYQVEARVDLKNITVEGLKEAKVRKARLRADEERFHLEIDMYSPKIIVTGLLHGVGAFNAIKVNTTGTFNCTMLDLVYTWKLDGKPEVKNNVTYMKIHDFYMRPDVGHMIASATTDDQEIKPLFTLGNDFLNQNWKLLYKELLPYAQASWKKSGTHISNKIFLKTPYDQLYPVNA